MIKRLKMSMQNSFQTLIFVVCFSHQRDRGPGQGWSDGGGVFFIKPYSPPIHRFTIQLPLIFDPGKGMPWKTHSQNPSANTFLLSLLHSASPPLTNYFPSPNTSLFCLLHSISPPMKKYFPFPFFFSTGDQINQISSGRQLMNARFSLDIDYIISQENLGAT